MRPTLAERIHGNDREQEGDAGDLANLDRASISQSDPAAPGGQSQLNEGDHHRGP
jgi:hypothetical protein